MQISIWQQWASNHSADFIIVGKFQSPQEAQSAADELRSILDTIIRWYKNNPDEPSWEEEPSPPEKQLAQQYGIAWPERHRWLQRRAKYGLDVEWAVNVLEQFVFLASWDEEGAPATPFEEIVLKLGAKNIVVDQEMHGDITLRMNVTCVAPDAVVAQSIWESSNAYFHVNIHTYLRMRGVPIRPVPWIAHVQRWQENAFGPVNAVLTPSAGIVKRENLTLHFIELDLLDRQNIHRGLFALLDWLREQGCIDVVYDFIGSTEFFPSKPRVQVSFTAPDEATAQELAAAVQKTPNAVHDREHKLPGLVEYWEDLRVQQEGLHITISDLLAAVLTDEELEQLKYYLVTRGCTHIQHELVW